MTKIKMFENEDGILEFHGSSDDPVATKATFQMLQRNGTFCPGIEKVRVNAPKGENPVGSVHVTFKDGTKVTVHNTKGDKFSAETGLVFAIVKRLFGNVNDNTNEVSSGSYMHKLNKILKNAETPEKIEAARKEKEAKKLAKEAAAKAAKVAKANDDNVNLKDVLKLLTKALSKLEVSESK